MQMNTSVLALPAALVALMLGGCAVDSAASTSDGAAGARPKSSVTPVAQEKTTFKKVRSSKDIPFSRDTVRTSDLDKGEVVVDQEGQPGRLVQVVRVKLKDGVEVGREIVRSYVAQKPVAQVKLVGTHVDPKPVPKAPSCDSNYAGACVPIASDVDCAGGSGDGPAYVQGPVEIVGTDVYDLNRDGDNIACDS